VSFALKEISWEITGPGIRFLGYYGSWENIIPIKNHLGKYNS
jgi:hypothetical protein